MPTVSNPNAPYCGLGAGGASGAGIASTTAAGGGGGGAFVAQATMAVETKARTITRTILNPSPSKEFSQKMLLAAPYYGGQRQSTIVPPGTANGIKLLQKRRPKRTDAQWLTPAHAMSPAIRTGCRIRTIWPARA
jgi:hypothetical protein